MRIIKTAGWKKTAIRSERTLEVPIEPEARDFSKSYSLNREILDWRGDIKGVLGAIHRGLKPDEDTLAYAMKTKNMELVQRLIDFGAPADTGTLAAAIQTQDPKFIQLAISLGCKPNEFTLTEAKRTKKQPVINMIENLLSQYDIESHEEEPEEDNWFDSLDGNTSNLLTEMLKNK